ncbi:MAG: hypothetical protein WC711_02540 [Candidatus Staskawiczbacteria bacterium]|jgi:hypothetical protein
MAVVFISPKKRQKMFFVVITLIFLSFLIISFLGVFLSEPKKAEPTLVLNQSKINIDMTVFTSEKFKNLESSFKMDWQYSYKAISRSNKAQEGFVSATSEEEATKALQEMGFSQIVVTKVEPGRDNPFVRYYSVIVVPPPAPTPPETPVLPEAEQ